MDANAKITHYTVTDPRNGKTRVYKSGIAACNAAERINFEYGAHIVSRRAVWSDAK